MDALMNVAELAAISVGLIVLLTGPVSLEGLFRLAFHKPRVRNQSSRR